MVYELSSFNNSFIPELGQHLQHVEADLLWIIIQTGTDDTEAVWCQNPAMQPVGLIQWNFWNSTSITSAFLLKKCTRK